MEDISTIEDIQSVVDSFYSRIRTDDLLSGIFNEVIGNQWPEHLEKMYSFWQTVLLEERTYTGSPFPPHANLPVSKEHFDRWLQLFHKTVDEYFAGKKADEAKWRADKMAELFLHKINYFKNNPNRIL
ncbi:MAG TPA: group III truncated hemoglobin [Chitinophagales bacterium]|nr:group III truncated hemoglobin [Chitinophagales bacterium]